VHHAFAGQEPQVADSAYVAPSADLIGRVHVEPGACVLFQVVLRGDSEDISVGEGSNVQDGVVVHADPGFPATIGSGVSIGHNATIHGCQIDNNCLIGMSATIMNGATIGSESLVAAGAVVLEGTTIPPRSLVAGVPAKVIRELGDDDVAAIYRNAEHYREKTAQYLAG